MKKPTFLFGNSQEDFNGEDYCKCRTEEEFEQACKHMGWDDAAQFVEETSVTFNDIKDEWFIVIKNRVYFNDGPDGKYPIYEQDIPEWMTDLAKGENV